MTLKFPSPEEMERQYREARRPPQIREGEKLYYVEVQWDHPRRVWVAECADMPGPVAEAPRLGGSDSLAEKVNAWEKGLPREPGSVPVVHTRIIWPSGGDESPTPELLAALRSNLPTIGQVLRARVLAFGRLLRTASSALRRSVGPPEKPENGDKNQDS